MEAQAIQDIAARLVAFPSTAPQRLKALRERVSSAMAGKREGTPWRNSAAASVHSSRYEVKVAPSDGHCLCHAMVLGVLGGGRWSQWTLGAAMSMRQRVAQHMLENSDGEWGGALL